MNRFIYDNTLKFRIQRHIVFFVLTVICFAFIFYFQNKSDGFTQSLWITFVNSIPFFAYAYITIFLLIPEFIIKAKVAWFILLFVLVGVGLSAIKLVISDRVFYAAISPENLSERGIMSLKYIIVNTKDMTFIVALFCIGKYIKDYLYAEKIRRILEEENREAKLKLYQSQFDPHFLFNTINNLYALSLLNPLKTMEVVARIKTVLNYIVEEIQKDFVYLKDEIALVENYIQLEKLRYGNRLKIEFITKGETGYFKLPPMILFYLVENGFRHGSSLDAGSPWIKIKIKTEPGLIAILTENSKPKSAHNKNANKIFKLENLTKRLDLIYTKEGYDLLVDNNEEQFQVELILNTNIEFQQKTYR